MLRFLGLFLELSQVVGPRRFPGQPIAAPAAHRQQAVRKRD
jgi:hypothetical protein